MKKTVCLLLSIILVIGMTISAFADDLQQEFLKDMAEGLSERYEKHYSSVILILLKRRTIVT